VVTVTASDITHRSVLRTLARRSLPRVAEATIVPAVLFYVSLLVLGVWAAFGAALLWSYGAIVRRMVGHGTVPPLLVLSTVALTMRTALALASGSTFIYFVQPVLGTVAMAFVFLGSLAMGQPLVARLATEFWPLTPDVAGHPAVVRLFRALTILWAGVNLACAAVTFVLLVTLPVEGFVPAKMITGYLITGAGIMVTVGWSIATARREGLLHAVTAAVAA
jgi:uncharacterized membrane protein